MGHWEGLLTSIIVYKICQNIGNTHYTPQFSSLYCANRLEIFSQGNKFRNKLWKIRNI